MAGIIHKAKEAVDKVVHPEAHHGTTTAGPHDSNVGNKMDPRVDSDRDGHHVGQGTAGAFGGSSHTHGGALDPHTRTTAGPHTSDTANKLDPRVDSDRDGSHFGQRTAGGTLGGTHTSTTGGMLGSSTHTTAGPHDSDMLNKMDPRVDSDRDGRGPMQPGGTTGLTGSGYGSTGAGYGSGTTGFGSTGTSATAGPHSSNLANQLDPRVDSDRDRGTHDSGLTGSGLTGSGLTGSGHTGSGLTGSSHTSSGITGTHAGTHSHSTAGPHSSNLANKLDPRVDSDMDGRRL